MCGIAFVINYGKEEVDLDRTELMFSNMETRGRDASGFYFEREERGKLVRRMKKAPIPAQELWDLTQIAPQEGQAQKEFRKFELNGKEKLLLLHTRTMTQGSRYDNNNNHPLFSKNFVLVHNGIVNDLNPVPNYPYKGLVDSEHILARIEKYGIKDGLKGLNGDIAIIFKRQNEHAIYVIRNYNPLDMAWLPDQQVLMGISDSDYCVFPGDSSVFSKVMFTPSPRVESLPKNWLYKISTDSPEILSIKEIVIDELDYNTKTDVKSQVADKKKIDRKIGQINAKDEWQNEIHYPIDSKFTD